MTTNPALDIGKVFVIMLPIVACFLMSAMSPVHTAGVPHATDISYTEWGDINLGGLFPMHLYQENVQDCGELRSLDALKRVEAMAYMIRRVNANNTILPNITLGYEIYDTCSYSAPALRQSLKMIPSQRQVSQCALNASDPLPPIMGVVGAQRSASSLQAAILFGLYSIPQVSYLSTSDELSNADRYPYFLRTVPPDRFQVNAMVDLLLKYKWKYVSFINSDDTYGKSAQTEFRSRAAEHDICLAVARTIPASTETYDEIIQDLLETQSATTHSTVVILFVQLEVAKKIFAAADAAGAQRRFIWIGSDGWGNYDLQPVEDHEEVALGAFTVVPLSGVFNKYNDYFMRMSPTTSSNPWLEDFLEKYGLCEEGSTVNDTCLSRSFEGVEGLENPAHETIVMDSVLAFANALHDMQVTLCGDPILGLCEAMQQANGTVLRNALLKTKFVSPVNGDLEFMPNGDMGGRYSIRNLQQVEQGKYEFLHVGTWVDSAQEKLTITTTIPWYLTGNSTLWDNTTGDPQSVCSTPCDTGEKRTVLPENPCCWSCTPCQTSEIVINNGTVCDSCIKAEQNTYGWPDELRTGCVPLSPAVNNAWVTAIVILSAFGLFGTFLTIAIYVHNREKPLIKASSRELSYIIFTGLVLAFLTSMLFGIKPNPGVCALRRIGSPVALSLIYVSIATKTIRLYRIFRAGLKSARRPRFISPTSQVTLTLVICIVPVVWATAWFILIPPAVEITMPDPNEPKIELACDESDIEVIGTITWEICLIMVCCVFAFVTRKLPENYNESRFITFCVFSSLVVFSSFAPAFFTTREAVYKASYNALGLIINGTVTLMCLFVVKIYALYFVDERELNIFTQSRTRSNTRTNSMINVHTSEGSIPPANPTSPSGPQVNHGFKTEAAVKRDVEAENLNHSSNNNNRLSLPPIQTSQTMEVVSRVNHSSELQTFERDVGRSRSSSKNSVGGSGRGASGSLMTRLRGNSSRVGDTGASRIEQSLDRRSGEVSSMHTKGDESGKHHALGQLQRFSADSDSSQGDDHRVLLNVKKAHREAVS